MDESRKSPYMPLLVGIIALVIGLIIGLVVLGWWLWPVRWYDAMPVHLQAGRQEDYLRMAIDSYAYNQDAELAKSRFSGLGEDAASTLQAIQANPGTQNPAAITAFSSVVQGVAPEPAKATGFKILNLGVGLLCILLVLVMIGLLIYFLLRSPGKQIQPEPPAPEGAPFTGEDVEPFTFEETPPAEALAPEPPTSFPDLEPSNIDTLPALVVAKSLEDTQPTSGVVGDTKEQIQPSGGTVVDTDKKPDGVDTDKTPDDDMSVMSYGLTDIEGVGEVYAQKLKDLGIKNLEMLLEGGATPKGREIISQRTGISQKLILKWVNNVDLFRIKGVGSEYADLLEKAGVDTVVELATRNPVNLHEKMIAVNEEKKLVRKLPVLSQVEDWVEQAKQLPRMVRY